MSNRNLNLNTLLPKLATILSLLGIGLNLILHVIRTGSLVSFEWQWTLVGLLASGYFIVSLITYIATYLILKKPINTLFYPETYPFLLGLLYVGYKQKTKESTIGN